MLNSPNELKSSSFLSVFFSASCELFRIVARRENSISIKWFLKQNENENGKLSLSVPIPILYIVVSSRTTRKIQREQSFRLQCNNIWVEVKNKMNENENSLCVCVFSKLKLENWNENAEWECSRSSKKERERRRRLKTFSNLTCKEIFTPEIIETLKKKKLKQISLYSIKNEFIVFVLVR